MQCTSSFEKGFALIATISVMTLLVMVALAMLSLSTVEMRQGKNANARAEARANARLALMIAMGEIQKSLGPDQRVTARAAIYDSSPNTTKIDEVKHPYWLQVYRTTKENGDSIYERYENQERKNDGFNGIHDSRFAQGDWKREEFVQACLVSGNEGLKPQDAGYLDPVKGGASLSDDDLVSVLAMGLDQSDPRHVQVKKIETLNGAYGYWVADNGMAAKISVHDPYHGKQANASSPADGGYFRILAASEVPGEAVNRAFDIDGNSTAKMVDSPQIGLVSPAAREQYKEHWHDITAHGYGIPVDVMRGKLKRDLSDYFQRAGTGAASISRLQDAGELVSPGISDYDFLVGVPNADSYTWWNSKSENPSYSDPLKYLQYRKQTAPRFAVLRKFAQLRQHVAFKDGQSNAVLPEEEPNPNRATGPFDGTNNRQIKLISNTTHSVNPILTEASLYWNISSYPTSSGGVTVHNLRLHLYPRMTVWNPYNLKMNHPDLYIMFHSPAPRTLTVASISNRDIRRDIRTNMGLVGGVNAGAVFFRIPAGSLEPGECLVYSPGSAAQYTAGLNHTLQPVAPSPSRCFYINGQQAFSGPVKTVGGKQYPIYQFPARPSVYTQANGTRAEDVRVLMKTASSGAGHYTSFYNMQMLQIISGSPKLGATSEQPLAWNTSGTVDVQQSTITNGALNQEPDRRTRESVRLRWVEEPQANLDNLGDMPPRMFQSAFLANWNIRGSIFSKTPWSNTAPIEPFYHGVYSRDIGGPQSAWGMNFPNMIGGKARGNPFGPHPDAQKNYVLFDVPRSQTGIVSMGQLMHARISEYGWHPSYAIGNSFADPRMELTQTLPVTNDIRNRGWNSSIFGIDMGTHDDYISQFGRGWVQHLCSRENLVYDLSYELNHILWDSFFISTLNDSNKSGLLTSGHADALPNSRHKLMIHGREKPDPNELDFHRAAKWLVVDGAFNVNSTSVHAWKSILSATRDTGMGEHVFPRVLNAPGGAFQKGGDPYGEAAWSGYRELSSGSSNSEIEELAEQIVIQVKERGPFLSLSDFINRRLVPDEHGLMGALQTAIEKAKLNDDFMAAELAVDRDALPDVQINDPNYELQGISDSTKIQQENKAPSQFAAAPGYLTQADILQSVGSTLSARSDCFTIRAYGESRDADGNVLAKAWCEAVVQRGSEPINPASKKFALNPKVDSSGKPLANDFGRKFHVVSFRWLSPEEV